MTARFKEHDEIYARVGKYGWVKAVFRNYEEGGPTYMDPPTAWVTFDVENDTLGDSVEKAQVFLSEIMTKEEYWRDEDGEHDSLAKPQQNKLVSTDGFADVTGPQPCRDHTWIEVSASDEPKRWVCNLCPATSAVCPDSGPAYVAEPFTAKAGEEMAPTDAEIAAAQAYVEPTHSGLDKITKDTNPKDALAGNKPRWFSFLPIRVLVGVGKALFEGGYKYGKHNYRVSGVRASVYLDAAVCGHLMPFIEGQNVDENGMCHIDKAIASLMVLKDSMIGGNWVDDRPVATDDFDDFMEEHTAHFGQMKLDLKAKFGDPVAPFTNTSHGKK